MVKEGYLDYNQYIILSKTVGKIHHLRHTMHWLMTDFYFVDRDTRVPKAIFWSTDNQETMNLCVKQSGIKGIAILLMEQEELTVDYVLDRINEVGYEYITTREKMFLAYAKYHE